MNFSPTGTLYLLGGVPLDNTYEHTLDFSSEGEQYSYFYGKVSKTFDEYTVIKKDTSVKIQANIESLWEVNYCMYRNATNSKIVYGFIVEKRYISDTVTELILETDVMQTYLFDYEWKDSFVEREHQDRWTGVNQPIFNLNEEGLDVGNEYIKDREQVIKQSEKYFLIVATDNITTTLGGITKIQDYPTPFFYYVVPSTSSAGIMSSIDLAELGKNPKVIGIHYIPFMPCALNTLDPMVYQFTSGTTKVIYRINYQLIATFLLGTAEKYDANNIPQGFGIGVPRNPKYESKLLCYPYSYHLVSDMQTKPMLLKNEYLSGNLVSISCTQLLSHDIKTKYFVSTGYLGETDGKMHNAINNTVNDLPLISDAYRNYMLTQKAQMVTGLSVGMGTALGTLAIGAMTGGIGLAVGGAVAMQGISQVENLLAKKQDLQNTPDSVRNFGNNIAFDLVDGNTALKFFDYSIHTKYKKIIGDFFAKYGYKCLEVKKPNTKSRYYYNYIKTIGANIKGEFDNKDLAKMKQVFNNGVTIWHMTHSITPLDYTYDNVEVTLA